MKTDRRKKILFFILMLVTVVAVWYAGMESVIRTGESGALDIQNESNAGKIGRGVTVTQTFEAQEDFRGISLLIGTFGEKQQGLIEVEIANADTGETVFQKNYDTASFTDNRYFCFASEDMIEVSEPTTFEITVTGIFALPGKGVTVWCSQGDDYANGNMTVQGTPQDGDLCFGIVKEYEEHMGWGIFSKRLMIIALVTVFLALHCFFGYPADV